MRARSSRLLWYVMLTATVLLMAALMLSASADRAGALAPSETAVVREAISSYVQAQYLSGDSGEAGFLITGSALRARLDSNDDGAYLGEGDDAALAPVLVDVLSTQGSWIPGTSYRLSGSWYNAANTVNAPVVRNFVQRRESAGFNFDIVTYCLTGHTESPPVMAYGAMAQAGYFGTAEPPATYGLKWGRNGWNTVTKAYGNTNPITSQTLAGGDGSAPASSAACSGLAADELVRCVASEAMGQINTNGGAGAGVAPWPALSAAAYSPVDIREFISQTMANPATGGAYAIHDPLPSVFDSANLTGRLYGSGKINIFANCSQHTGLITAQGAQMLGYPSEGLQWGLPNWNYNLCQGYINNGAGSANKPLVTTPIDTSAPTVSSVTATSITSTSVVITRVALEPATMKIEYGTAPGVYTGVVNHTILNASKSLEISGLEAGTTYYYRVTSYDGLANSTQSPEASLETPCQDGTPDLRLYGGYPEWKSYSDYTARQLTVTWEIYNYPVGIPGNQLQAFNINITGSVDTQGVSLLTQLPAYAGNLPGGGSALMELEYHIPAGVGSWHTSMAATAEDECGTQYQYPQPEE